MCQKIDTLFDKQSDGSANSPRGSRRFSLCRDPKRQPDSAEPVDGHCVVQNAIRRSQAPGGSALHILEWPATLAAGSDDVQRSSAIAPLSLAEI